MEKLLELSDSYNSNYPEHFQTFLDNCITIYNGDFRANDYLFAAVYFLVLETGFSPTILKSIPNDDSVNFDIRKLRSVTGYSDGQIKLSKQSNLKAKYFIYQIELKLGNIKSSFCELQGVPSEVNNHLIINLLSKNSFIIKSLCLNTETYIEEYKNATHKFLLKNLKDLSILIKNKISTVIKNILLAEESGCNPNLYCLPEEIQKKIIYLLLNDPVSIQYLSSTCTYFYNFITNDPKLWEEISFREYGGLALNAALEKTSATNDFNVFRTAFLNLKNKKWKRNELLDS